MPFHVYCGMIMVFSSNNSMIFTINVIVVMVNATTNCSCSGLPSSCTSCCDITSDNLNYHDATTCHGLPVSHFPGKWYICTFFKYVCKLTPKTQLKWLILGLLLMLLTVLVRVLSGNRWPTQIGQFQENLIKGLFTNIWPCMGKSQRRD